MPGVVEWLGENAGVLVALAVWGAWWLWGADWCRLGPALAAGAWAPTLLIVLMIAAVWAWIAPNSADFLGMKIPNGYWQLGIVLLWVAVAGFCGWLQDVLRCRPEEIGLEPPLPAAHAHGHHSPH